VSRRIVAAALCAWASACSNESPGPVGHVRFSLTPAASPDPFLNVKTVGMTLQAPGAAPVRLSFAPDGGVSFPPVSPGSGFRVSFEGLDDQSNVVSAGRSGPVSLTAEDRAQPWRIFFGRVQRFSVVGGAEERRVGHTATALADGRVLLLGGVSGDPLAASPTLATAVSFYDPSTAAVQATGGSFSRRDHTATLLPDGKTVVVLGGRDAGGTVLPAVGSFDTSLPSAGMPTPVQDALLPDARAGHTTTLLPDGNLLLVGGQSTNGDVVGSTQLYDPRTRSFGAKVLLFKPRFEHTATLLSDDGRVLIAGGRRDRTTFFQSLELQSPSGLRELSGVTLARSRALHSATLLPDGRVLIAGGWDGGTSPIDDFEILEVTTAVTRSLSVVDAVGAPLHMDVGRAGHVAVSLGGMSVLIAGGGNPASAPPSATDTAFVITVGATSESGTVTATLEAVNPGLGTARLNATAAVMPDGNIFVAGGAFQMSSSLAPASALEIFIPRSQ
jgi:hypothetical protein